jgi:hypothetical protein
MAMGGFWLIQLGILGILDKFLFKAPAPEGQKNTGPMVWGIIMLVFAGFSALSGLWGMISSLRFLSFIANAPIPFLFGFLSAGCKIALSVFLILGGISRLKRSTPGMGALKMIFGIACVVLGLSSFFVYQLMGYY